MSRGKQRFKKTEMKRAIEAAQEMGLTDYRIEIVNGLPAIVVRGHGPDMGMSKDSGVSSWDKIIQNLEGQANVEAGIALRPINP